MSRGHTSGGKVGSDEVAAIPLEERNGRRDWQDWQMGRRRDQEAWSVEQLTEGLNGREDLGARTVVGRCWAGWSGLRAGVLHAARGIAAPAGFSTLTELPHGHSGGRPVRVHQCKAEQNGNKGLHAWLQCRSFDH